MPRGSVLGWQRWTGIAVALGLSISAMGLEFSMCFGLDYFFPTFFFFWGLKHTTRF